jgi:Ctf8
MQVHTKAKWQGPLKGDGWNDQAQPVVFICHSNGRSFLLLSLYNQKPVMTIGSHILTGTVQTLKDPFCLMEKQYSIDENGRRGIESYQIIGVVKQKYLFNSYPKVITQ